jgi:NADPH:quinone reductase-like Zn-dependent oxidoreductase
VSGTIVYLDMCALKRPFDDARSDRIRREAEAVARIFEKVENGSIHLVVSAAHRFENDRNPREDRVQAVKPDQLPVDEENRQ